MKKSMEKDKKRRLDFLKFESSRKLLKFISHNLNLPLSFRSKATLSLSELSRSSSLMRVKKRCVLTGRGRFVLGPFNLSRLMFRKLARNNLIPGLRKSSW